MGSPPNFATRYVRDCAMRSDAMRCDAIDDFRNGARATTANEMRDANVRNSFHDIHSFDVAIERESHRARVNARSFKDS